MGILLVDGIERRNPSHTGSTQVAECNGLSNFQAQFNLRSEDEILCPDAS